MSDGSPLSSTTEKNQKVWPWAVAAGVTAGAAALGKTARWARQQTLPAGPLSPPALDAEVETLEMMEGNARFYFREGTGRPLVFIHSFNAAASSFEMKPLFESAADLTRRPLFALDWLGFGLSDRPDIRYRPELFQRQLRRFMNEHVPGAADVIALSLGGEYAATLALTAPFHFNRLVLLSPTSLGAKPNSSSLRYFLVHGTAATGGFELFFYRLAQRDRIRSFYERQVFLTPDDVPDELVDYAHLTANVKGAHRAPRYFVAGDLFLDEVARNAYAKVTVPTLMVIPEKPESTVQRFERVKHTQARNQQYLHAKRLRSGLMPQWDALDRLQPLLTDFLSK